MKKGENVGEDIMFQLSKNNLISSNNIFKNLGIKIPTNLNL